MQWNCICCLVMANSDSLPTSSLGFIPSSCAPNSAVTWWVTKEARGAYEDGEKGFCDAQVYISFLNPIPRPSPPVTGTKASSLPHKHISLTFLSPCTEQALTFISTWFQLKKQGASGNTRFLFSAAQIPIGLALGFASLQKWLKVWYTCLNVV